MGQRSAIRPTSNWPHHSERNIGAVDQLVADETILQRTIWFVHTHKRRAQPPILFCQLACDSFTYHMLLSVHVTNWNVRMDGLTVKDESRNDTHISRDPILVLRHSIKAGRTAVIRNSDRYLKRQRPGRVPRATSSDWVGWSSSCLRFRDWRRRCLRDSH